MRLMPFSSPKYKLILWSLMHFATDGLCSYLVFAKLYPDNPSYAFYVFIAYNVLAFVTQSPVGILIDRFNRPKTFLGVSIAAMLLGYILSGVWLLSVILIGMSNSVFHVAGGKYVTDKSGNDISHLGIFVSTGAIGLALGQTYADSFIPAAIFFTLLIGSYFLMLVSADPEKKEYSEIFTEEKYARYAMLAVTAIVLARSFVGKVIKPDFTPFSSFLIVVSLFVAAGKATGGMCAKRFGIRLTALVSLCLAAICLCLGTANPFTYIIGIFAFNFSMPITLYFANILLKGKEGFAFGTLAAILTPGYFLGVLVSDYSLLMKILTALLCVLSIVAILIILKRINKNDGATLNHDHT
ncbi:MAG: hypothetical protein IJW02_06580 [Clostridia bacterium]|nr:hypothetical protein [Clostridia bacterium]